MNKEQRRVWRVNNPDKHREEQRLYYQRHRDAVKRRTGRLKRKYPERSRVYAAKRRTLKTKAGGHTTPKQWLIICRAVKFRCLCCGMRRKLQPDHVIPVCKGGSSWPHNLQPLCGTCNEKKQIKSTDFRNMPKWQTVFTRLRKLMWFCSESKTLCDVSL